MTRNQKMRDLKLVVDTGSIKTAQNLAEHALRDHEITPMEYIQLVRYSEGRPSTLDTYNTVSPDINHVD